MRTALVISLGLLLLPVAGWSDPAAAAATNPTVMPATGTSDIITVTGKLDTHMLAKPTVTTADGKVYRLIGPQRSTLDALKDIDKKSITVSGVVVQDGSAKPMLSVETFQVAGMPGAIGVSVPGFEENKLMPATVLTGNLSTKLLGKPELTTPDNKTYKLIGPQVATIDALSGLNKVRIQATGQIVTVGKREDMVLLGFHVIDAKSKLSGAGMIGWVAPGGDKSQVTPPVVLQGTLSTKLLGKPELTTADKKVLKLIGPEIALIDKTKNIDNQKVEIQGQLLDDGKSQKLVVSSFRILGQTVGALPANGAPPAYGQSSINPNYGAPPQRETMPAEGR